MSSSLDPAAAATEGAATAMSFKDGKSKWLLDSTNCHSAAAKLTDKENRTPAYSPIEKRLQQQQQQRCGGVGDTGEADYSLTPGSITRRRIGSLVYPQGGSYSPSAGAVGGDESSGFGFRNTIGFTNYNNNNNCSGNFGTTAATAGAPPSYFFNPNDNSSEWSFQMPQLNMSCASSSAATNTQNNTQVNGLAIASTASSAKKPRAASRFHPCVGADASAMTLLPQDSTNPELQFNLSFGDPGNTTLTSTSLNLNYPGSGVSGGGGGFQPRALFFDGFDDGAEAAADRSCGRGGGTAAVGTTLPGPGSASTAHHHYHRGATAEEAERRSDAFAINAADISCIEANSKDTSLVLVPEADSAYVDRQQTPTWQKPGPLGANSHSSASGPAQATATVLSSLLSSGPASDSSSALAPFTCGTLEGNSPNAVYERLLNDILHNNEVIKQEQAALQLALLQQQQQQQHQEQQQQEQQEGDSFEQSPVCPYRVQAFEEPDDDDYDRRVNRNIGSGGARTAPEHGAPPAPLSFRGPSGTAAAAAAEHHHIDPTAAPRSHPHPQQQQQQQHGVRYTSQFRSQARAAPGSLVAIGGRRIPVEKLHLLTEEETHTAGDGAREPGEREREGHEDYQPPQAQQRGARNTSPQPQGRAVVVGGALKPSTRPVPAPKCHTVIIPNARTSPAPALTPPPPGGEAFPAPFHSAATAAARPSSRPMPPSARRDAAGTSTPAPGPGPAAAGASTASTASSSGGGGVGVAAEDTDVVLALRLTRDGADGGDVLLVRCNHGIGGRRDAMLEADCQRRTAEVLGQRGTPAAVGSGYVVHVYSRANPLGAGLGSYTDSGVCVAVLRGAEADAARRGCVGCVVRSLDESILDRTRLAAARGEEAKLCRCAAQQARQLGLPIDVRHAHFTLDFKFGVVYYSHRRDNGGRPQQLSERRAQGLVQGLEETWGCGVVLKALPFDVFAH